MRISMGDKYAWNNENFVLFNIKGMRKSNTEFSGLKLFKN